MLVAWTQIFLFSLCKGNRLYVMYERKVIQIYTHTLTSIQRKVIKNEILPLFGMPWKSDNIFYAKKYYLWRTEGATFHIRGRQCAHHRQQEQQLQQGNNIKNKNKKTENKKSAYSCSQVGKWHFVGYSPLFAFGSYLISLISFPLYFVTFC